MDPRVEDNLTELGQSGDQQVRSHHRRCAQAAIAKLTQVAWTKQRMQRIKPRRSGMLRSRNAGPTHLRSRASSNSVFSPPTG